MRLRAMDPGLVVQLMNSANADDIALALPLIALTEHPDSPALPQRPQPGLAHAWWLPRAAPTSAAVESAVMILTEETHNPTAERLEGDAQLTLRGRIYHIPPSPTSDQLSLALDWVEAARLSGVYPDMRVLDGVARRWQDNHAAADDQARWLLRNSAQAIAALPLPRRHRLPGGVRRDTNF